MRWYLLLIFLVLVVFMIKPIEAGWWNTTFNYYINISVNDSVEVPRINDIGKFCINHSASNLQVPYNDSLRLIDSSGNKVRTYTVYNVTYTSRGMDYYCIDFLFNRTTLNANLNFSVYYDVANRGKEDYLTPTIVNGSLEGGILPVVMINNSVFHLNISYEGLEANIDYSPYFRNSIQQSNGNSQYWSNATDAARHFEVKQTTNTVGCMIINDTFYAKFQCRSKTIKFNLTYFVPYGADYYIVEAENETNSYTNLKSNIMLTARVDKAKLGNSTNNYSYTFNDALLERWNIDWWAYLNITNPSGQNWAYWTINNLSTFESASRNYVRADSDGGVTVVMTHVATGYPIIYSGRLYRGIRDLGIVAENYTINLTKQFNTPVRITAGKENTLDASNNPLNIIINSPSGISTTTTVSYNINYSSTSGVTSCKFNVTDTSKTQVIAPTSINCNNFTATTGSFSVSSDGIYIFWAEGVRQSDSSSLNCGVFTVRRESLWS